MNRKIIPVSHAQLTSLDLEAFVRQAEALNQRNRERFTSPFPKCPSRWISHYQFEPRPITFTDQGAVEGGLSWLVGTTLDFSFARDLCADAYGTRGGNCYDPASLLFLEVAAKVDGYPDYASFCRDLEQAEKGRCYRDLAGLDEAIPGQDSFSNFRKRVGHSVVDQTMDIMVQLFIDFGLIKGEVVSTDGQLEPTHSRFKGCAYACEGCKGFAIDEAQRHDLAQQLQSGSLRLEIICPFPEVVDKVREATAKKGAPKDPKVALLEVEPLPPEQLSSKLHHKLAERLGVPQDQLPPVRLKWSHLSLGPSGELQARCPKVPSEGWSSDATSKPVSAITSTTRTQAKKSGSLATCTSKPPIFIPTSLWNYPWAIRRMRRAPMRAPSSLGIAAPWPCPCCQGKSSWQMPPMIR